MRALAETGSTLPRHQPPPAGGALGGRQHPGRARRPVLPPRRLRGAGRQRRQHRVLGRRRVRSGRPPRRAPRLRRVLLEVRRGHRGRAVPRRPGRARAPSPAPTRSCVADADRRRVRVPAQRDVDRRDDRRPPARRRPASCSSTPRRAPAGSGSSPRTSTSTTSRRRSASPPTVASGWRCALPPRSSASSASARSDRWVPPSLSLPVALENSRLDQTYNTPALGVALPPRAQPAVDARPGRPRVHDRSLRPFVEHPSTTGPRRARSRSRSSPTRPSAAT